jgi:hypothetical protein
MKPFSFLLFIFAGLFLANCSTTDNIPRKAMFPFEYEDETYQIVSISSSSGEGMNILLKVQNDTSVFRILDQDQDGLLDVVQHGDITLNEANEIYTFGIIEAKDAGKIRERERERLYQYSEDHHYFKVQTFGLYSDVFYNRFIVGNVRLGIEESFLDINADGVLDKAEYANQSHKDVQPYYHKVLQKGMENDRILVSNDKYIVKISYKSPPS